jgi:sarcosine oxidase subunit beta
LFLRAIQVKIRAMHVAIIGGGVIGCAIALEARRRGLAVTVIDRLGAVGHGTTSASCGIVRRFYSQPGMSAMAHESAKIWADWGNHLGPIDDRLAVFEQPGILFIPQKLDEETTEIVAGMQRIGIDVTLLSADEITARFPFIDTASHYPTTAPDDPRFFEPTGRRIEGGFFEEDAGYVIDPGLATQNLRSAAEREGAAFMLKREVVAIERDAAGFRLQFKQGEPLQSDVVVNASGPHSAIVNRMAGVSLPLETRALRREVHQLRNPLFDEKTETNPVPVIGDLDGGIYCRPEARGRAIIVGTTDPECDEFDWVDDPDDYYEGLTEPYHQRQCLRLMKRMPELELGPSRGVVSLYDVTVQDWYPVADKTDLPGYYVCIGTSGSSFKTAPVLGQLMAQIIERCEGGTDVDKAPLQLELPRIGISIDTRFVSRLRERLSTTATVIG